MDIACMPIRINCYLGSNLKKKKKQYSPNLGRFLLFSEDAKHSLQSHSIVLESLNRQLVNAP